MVDNLTKSLTLSIEALCSSFDTSVVNEFWFQNSGIAIFLALHGRILGYVQNQPKPDFAKYFTALRKHLGELKKAELKEFRVRCSSEGGRASVFKEFVLGIRKHSGEESFGGIDIADTKFEKRIKQIERGLANMLHATLSKADYNWCKTRVPNDIRKKAESRMSVAEDLQHDQLTFGEVCQLAKQGNNWPELKKQLEGKGAFENITEFEVAANFINKSRAKLVHGKGELSSSDEHVLIGYLMKFESVLQKSE